MTIVVLKVITTVCSSLAIIFLGVVRYYSNKAKKSFENMEMQRERKKEMCERAIIGRVCPEACDRCAWNWRKYERD